MINANEFRLGNIIQFRYMDKKEEREITYDDFRSIVDLSNGLGVGGYEIPSPIPLTGAWLKKFGFDKDGKRKCPASDHDDDTILTVSQDILGVVDGEDMGIYFGVIIEQESSMHDDEREMVTTKDIQYVHELQNLFFALTGTELPMK